MFVFAKQNPVCPEQNRIPLERDVFGSNEILFGELRPYMSRLKACFLRTRAVWHGRDLSRRDRFRLAVNELPSRGVGCCVMLRGCEDAAMASLKGYLRMVVL